jgi:hypothetical protein
MSHRLTRSSDRPHAETQRRCREEISRAKQAHIHRGFSDESLAEVSATQNEAAAPYYGLPAFRADYKKD